MSVRITQVAAQALVDNPAANARVTQVAAQALVDNPAANARVTQVVIQVLTEPQPFTVYARPRCRFVEI